MVDDHFLLEGKEKDVEAYEKLLLLDDDLYELKPEFENKDEVTKAEKKNDLQLRIFASLGWETDPEREYQVVGDEKIIFCLSNASETEQTAVIQVDEKTTEEIVLVPGSAVVVDSKSGEESLEAESGEESKEDGEQEEIENGESEGQAEEENNSEGIKGVGGNSSAGGAAGGNGGNSGNGSNGGNSSNSSDFSEKEDFVESGSSAEGEDFAESEGTVESETSAKNEGSAGNESSIENKNSAENEGKADESAADAEENRNDETQEKADAEGQDKESKDSQETVNKPESGNSQENTKEPGNTNTQENTNTQDKSEEKDERKDEEVKNNSASEKEETEKPDKTEAGNSESGKLDKAESGNAENGKADKADKPDKTDKSDNKESSKTDTSEKSGTGNTSAGKGEKSDTGKTENDRSGNSDSSKKSESTKKSSDSGSSDNSSDKGKEVSEGISRNVIRLVADNLEVSASDDMEETESAEETTIIDTQEKQKEEVIKEELEEIKAETEEVKTETEEAKEETEEVTTKTEEVKAETASPSDVEDNEIEGELYAPVVVNEESIIVFVTTTEELGLNRAELRKASDSNAKRISPAYEGEVELENVIVQVKADENVLPEGVKLQVKELKQEGEDAVQYEEAKEALDSQGTEYDGMMALDISFLDKKGREIEPDGNVQVSIKVKKESLPEEADLESIAVQHLAEDEGEIFVEEVADCGNKTRGNIEVEAKEHVEAAFEVDSFSVFTVTWMANDDNAWVVKFNLQFWCLKNGEPEEITQKIDYSDKSIEIHDKDISEATKNTGSWTFPMNDYFSIVQGYLYDHVEFVTEPYLFTNDEKGYYNPVLENYQVKKGESVNGTVDAIKVKKITSDINGGSFRYLVEVSKNGVKAPVICPSVYQGAMAEITLNIYYRENSLVIRDDILNNGQLEASRDLEPGQSYVWYKWSKDLNTAQCPEITDQNGKKTRDPQYQVLMKPVAGNKWNLESDGKILNAVHDGGANHYYLVTIRDKDGNEIMVSSPFLVDFSDKIENGSFESPIIRNVFSSGDDSNLNYYFVPQDTVGLLWKSTRGEVEIVHKDSNAGKDGHLLNGQVAQGNQCAELNAHYEGALYQDVLTAPGATLHWSLWHRARGPAAPGRALEDTMYVVIMPENQAKEKLEEWDNNVTALAKDIQNNPEKYPDSTRVWELTSPQAWTFYTGDYVVGDGQYFTRFFFVAGDTASNNKSVGNLLDDIRFGSESAEIVQGGVSIKKLVQGLLDENMKNYDLTIQLKKKDGTYTKDITLNQFTITNGVYSEAQNITGLEEGEYTIEEILTGKEIPKTISMEKVEWVNGAELKTSLPIQYTKEGNPQTTITIENGKLTNIQIANSYIQPSDSFVVSKVFKNGSEKEFKQGEVSFSDVEFGLYLANSEWNSVGGEPLNRGKIRLETKNESDADNNADVTGIVEFSSLREGYYLLREIDPPAGYIQADDRKIFVGKQGNKFGVYLYDGKGYICVSDKDQVVEIENIENEEMPDIPGAILPDTGGPGLAMFERYGWFLLMLALLMAGVEVRCYGERKYRRASVGQHEEFEDPI